MVMRMPVLLTLQHDLTYATARAGAVTALRRMHGVIL